MSDAASPTGSATATATLAPALEIRDLEYRYGDRRALAGVSFSVNRGEVFGLLGPNGGGKTTLFRILSTLAAPHGGGASILGLDLAAQAAQVRARIGVVFQAPSLDRKLTVSENLMHQGHLYGLRGADLAERARAMLVRLGVADRAGDRVETLSGGLQRRVELAKGLLHRPDLVLLDEPSTGLDPAVRRGLMDYLRALRDEYGLTVVLTTHILEEAEACDRVAILDAGKLVALGAPEELKRRLGGEVLRLSAADPDALAADIGSRWDLETAVVDGQVRLEHPRGHAFVAELFDAFPGRIQEVHLGKPTLEDVFVRETGHRFVAESPAAPAGTGKRHGRRGGRA